MISYNDIPDCIKNSKGVLAIRKKSPFWDDRKLLSVYIEACKEGVKPVRESGLSDCPQTREFQLTRIAVYYVLRKEFLKRMSPLVSARSVDMLTMDNKKILERLDERVITGVDKNMKDTYKYLLEICNRIQGS